MNRKPVPQLSEIGDRLGDRATSAFNHAGAFLDDAVRTVLLSTAYVLVAFGRFLAEVDRHWQDKPQPRPERDAAREKGKPCFQLVR